MYPQTTNDNFIPTRYEVPYRPPITERVPDPTPNFDYTPPKLIDVASGKPKADNSNLSGVVIQRRILTSEKSSSK